MKNNPLFRLKPTFREWMEYGKSVGFIQDSEEESTEEAHDPDLPHPFILDKLFRR